MRVGLWIAAALVAGVASFPWWSPLVIRGVLKPAVTPAFAAVPTGSTAPSSQLTLTITGMTCAACAVTVQRGLQSIPDIIDAQVAFQDQAATLTWNASQMSGDRLVQLAQQVIQAEGYAASLPPRSLIAPDPACCP
jgi:copper chaperone CopZ